MGWSVCSAAWNDKGRSHLAPDHPVSFSLVVPATREDAWKRGAIVRGILGLPGFHVERVDGEDDNPTSQVRISDSPKIKLDVFCL